MLSQYSEIFLIATRQALFLTQTAQAAMILAITICQALHRIDNLLRHAAPTFLQLLSGAHAYSAATPPAGGEPGSVPKGKNELDVNF